MSDMILTTVSPLLKVRTYCLTNYCNSTYILLINMVRVGTASKDQKTKKGLPELLWGAKSP